MACKMGNKQFVVIAGGNGKLGTKLGDSAVAFALPQASNGAGNSNWRWCHKSRIVAKKQ